MLILVDANLQIGGIFRKQTCDAWFIMHLNIMLVSSWKEYETMSK